MKKFLPVLLILLLVLVGCGPTVVSGSGGALQQQATWTDILTLFVPLIAVGIMQLGWTVKVNSLIALAVTIGVAVLDAWYFGYLTDMTNLVNTVFNVLTIALVTYKTIWAPLGVIDWWAEKTTLKRFSPVAYAIGPIRGLPW